MKALLNSTLNYSLLLAVGLCLPACGYQPKPARAADPAGVYALVSVDGKPVPASISHDGTMLQVRSGAFTIHADGACSSRMIFVPPSGTEVTRDVSATYTRHGSKFNLRWKGAGRTVGTLDDNTFTMNNEGNVFVYRK